MTSPRLLVILALLIAGSCGVLAQQCNSTTGFITDIADFPTDSVLFVNFTEVSTLLGTQVGPQMLSFNNEISIELPSNQDLLWQGGWGLGANGNVHEYIAAANGANNFTFHFTTPVPYFATRVSYFPNDWGYSGYPIVTLFNEANEAVAGSGKIMKLP